MSPLDRRALLAGSIVAAFATPAQPALDNLAAFVESGIGGKK